MPAGALQAAGRRALRFIAMSRAEFWSYYLAAHRDPRSRALHYMGTLGAAALLVLAALGRDWRWLVAVPFVGYGPAWLGHLVFEHNRPATLPIRCGRWRATFACSRCFSAAGSPPSCGATGSGNRRLLGGRHGDCSADR